MKWVQFIIIFSVYEVITIFPAENAKNKFDTNPSVRVGLDFSLLGFGAFFTKVLLRDDSSGWHRPYNWPWNNCRAGGLRMIRMGYPDPCWLVGTNKVLSCPIWDDDPNWLSGWLEATNQLGNNHSTKPRKGWPWNLTDVMITFWVQWLVLRDVIM